MVSQQQISPLVHSIEETILRTKAGHADRRRLRLSQNYSKTLLGLFVLGVFVPELVLLSSSSAAAASSSCSSSAVADASSSVAAASSSASFLLILLFLLLRLHSRDSEQ
jgi:Mn2+/Fe2+ NRAMP family transporter